MLSPYFKSVDKKFYLLKGNSFETLPQFDHKFKMVFADPPYFLSNNGLSIQSGKIVSVNKGDWDKSKGYDFINDFNRQWLSLAREKMTDDGTIWISGTMHNIFSIAQILQELDFKILNAITWQKTNPPPNFSCRYFTHSTEQIIWARKMHKVPHYYNYELMKKLNGGKQMKDVWKLPAIAPWEKSCKKHPTQKPLSVLSRIILASTKPNDWILDPFAGSSTTGIAANLLNRRFLGIDQEEEYLEISKRRKFEIENPEIAALYRSKLSGFNHDDELKDYLKVEKKPIEYVALGYIRKKDIPSLSKKNTFYFHAIENDNQVRDFPTGILDAKQLYLYSGGRGKPFKLSGHHGEIESVKLLHKSKINGKAKSKTEYYYEVLLKENFSFNDTINYELKSEIFFDNDDKETLDNLKNYLPVIVKANRIV